ncbi:MAG TPA: CopG family transcriptional regulator [Thermoanaerobaculia bacterium]|jgi:hypothetical protein|nr:CopG family transcriptional regulator [Thermoanaerobaculia bacterium]
MARTVMVTLDDELAARLEEEARRTGVSLDAAVREAVRRGVDEPFRIDVRPLRARDGVSFECVARLLGEAEEEPWRR